jgi:hypothetical protein
MTIIYIINVKKLLESLTEIVTGTTVKVWIRWSHSVT